MHGPHDWNDPHDRARMERRMRAWGRLFERNMRRMGERMERDMRAAGDAFEHKADAASDAASGAAFGRTDRAQAGGYDSCSGAYWTSWSERHARRAARRAARHAARAAGRGACRPGFRGWYAWWWVIFPLFFITKNAVEDAGGWTGVGASAQSSLLSALDLTPAGPLAHLLARATGMTFIEAFGVLALAGVITAAAALIGWRMGQPSRAYEPSSDPSR